MLTSDVMPSRGPFSSLCYLIAPVYVIHSPHHNA